jgi:hypothetical protein
MSLFKKYKHIKKPTQPDTKNAIPRFSFTMELVVISTYIYIARIL